MIKMCKDAQKNVVSVLLQNVAQKQQWKPAEPRILVEALLGLCVVMGGGYFILVALGLPQLVFCLFCLLVFAIAIRSNRSISYGSGFIAALGYTFLIWHYTGMDMHLLLQAPFLMEPFLLIVVSILASDLLHSQRVRFYSIEMQAQQNKEKLLQLSKQFEKALESKKELQQLIIEQEAPIASVCQQITQLWQLNNEERYSAIVDLVIQATGAKSSALYLEKDHQFFLQTSRSIQNISYPSRLDEDDLLVKKVLQDDQVYTIREMLHAGQALPSDVPMMAGPLNKGGHLLGVVIVGTMPLTKFTLSTTQLFSALLQLVSISLQEPSPSSEANTIDIQVVLNDEKTQKLNRVLNDEKAPIPESEPDDEKTQIVSTLGRKHRYAH